MDMCKSAYDHWKFYKKIGDIYFECILPAKSSYKFFSFDDINKFRITNKIEFYKPNNKCFKVLDKDGELENTT